MCDTATGKTPVGNLVLYYAGAKQQLSWLITHQMESWKQMKKMEAMPLLKREFNYDQQLGWARGGHQNTVHSVKLKNMEVVALEIFLIERGYSANLVEQDLTKYKGPSLANTIILDLLNHDDDIIWNGCERSYNKGIRMCEGSDLSFCPPVG